ncbi:beta-galactosidase GalB [Niabella drilacis]|uniref:Beta-galactosidase n=1 Tax=Niabella drilacis (strain DSM 25811 / CCM 8410 / CCUG 62505 / LMG 26954 / E90) TaxID=1285928 RepID=A0A1G6R739_NIADE|nr:beta-galactosidase GalB [Niabella drilacis]SDD00223.1 beta-galactosidase [Niabella drilacis]
MRFILGLLAVILCGSGIHAQSSFTRLGSAGTTSFDEGWLFKRYGLQPDGTRLEEPQQAETAGFNDGDWQRLSLPHDFGITGPFRIDLSGNTGKLPWKGIGWYRKHFKIPAADAGKKIFIDFDGAMAYAEIWLNGHYVGTWPYGYTSFRMDLSPYLEFGKENVLAVKLNTEKWDSRWYPGAGIYRHVWLVKTEPVHVAHWGTYITTPSVTTQAADIKMAVTLDNQGNKPVKATLQTDIFEAGAGNTLKKKVASVQQKNIEVAEGSNNKVDMTVTIRNPRIWSIENPNRYFAVTTVLVNGKKTDTYYSTLGLRTLEFTARNGFLLNGKRVEIQGVCNHHDLGALGAAMNTSALKRQLVLLKEMGVNAIRTSHNPPAPELLELADEMGFLVWDEAFDAWKHGKKKNDYNKLYDEWHEKDLVALVHRDRNHPSVFIWSIGNEVMDQRDVAMTKELADIMRREDPTRPVSNGYNDPDGGRSSGAVQGLDLMGVNYFFGQQAKWDADPRYANMPTMGSETSSCVSSRGEYFFGTNRQNWQITSYDLDHPGWGCTPDVQFATNAKYPNLLGEFMWTGFDYLGEPTPYNSDETNLLNFRTDPSKRAELEKALEELTKNNPPSRSSYFGIIDLAGFPKDRFYLYQSHWRPNLPMAHILPHWNWQERIDSVVPVHVYTSGDEAELFLNGKSLGRKKKQPGKDFRLVWDDVVYAPGELKVIAYKQGKQWATDRVATTGEAAKLGLSSNAKRIKNNGQELAFITVKVEDKNGRMVPRSHPKIRFSVEGPGEIVATDNGDATSFESFQSPEKSAYNGMALVIVKAKKGARGVLKIKAAADGLTPGQAVVPVE